MWFKEQSKTSIQNRVSSHLKIIWPSENSQVFKELVVHQDDSEMSYNLFCDSVLRIFHFLPSDFSFYRVQVSVQIESYQKIKESFYLHLHLIRFTGRICLNWQKVHFDLIWQSCWLYTFGEFIVDVTRAAKNVISRAAITDLRLYVMVSRFLLMIFAGWWTYNIAHYQWYRVGLAILGPQTLYTYLVLCTIWEPHCPIVCVFMRKPKLE
jgi:hypothetical protein